VKCVAREWPGLTTWFGAPIELRNFSHSFDHRIAKRNAGDHRVSADRFDDWLDERAEELSTRTLRLIHQVLKRTIRQARARDKVRRNVASLVDVPEGQEGRPS
jgi:hypothetical protein